MPQKHTRITCRSYPYRKDVSTGSRTQAVLINVVDWTVLTPVRQVREVGTQGYDIYCLSDDEWINVIEVLLSRTGFRKTNYLIFMGCGVPEGLIRELDYILSTSRGFNDMLDNIIMWVRFMRTRPALSSDSP